MFAHGFVRGFNGTILLLRRLLLPNRLTSYPIDFFLLGI